MRQADGRERVLNDGDRLVPGNGLCAPIESFYPGALVLRMKPNCAAHRPAAPVERERRSWLNRVSTARSVNPCPSSIPFENRGRDWIPHRIRPDTSGCYAETGSIP